MSSVIAMEYMIIALIAYLLGAVPFGLVLTKLAGTQDIRTIGSGNIGATNVLRTGNKGLAAATLLLDAAKGGVAVLLAGYFVDANAALIAAVASVIGHMFPVYLKFKGGKGVATIFGVLFALNWVAGIATALLWLGFALVTRYSSLSALIASFCAPTIIWAMSGDQNAAFTVSIITALIWYKHRSNIERLVKGEEPRIGQK